MASRASGAGQATLTGRPGQRVPRQHVRAGAGEWTPKRQKNDGGVVRRRNWPGRHPGSDVVVRLACSRVARTRKPQDSGSVRHGRMHQGGADYNAARSDFQQDLLTDHRTEFPTHDDANSPRNRQLLRRFSPPGAASTQTARISCSPPGWPADILRQRPVSAVRGDRACGPAGWIRWP